MSERTPRLLIKDIVDSGEKIFRYTLGMDFEMFSTNELVIDAVIRNFEIIGEAANRLSEDFKDAYSEIDWHRIRGFRNRIVHDYAGIDLSIVWRIKEFFLSDTLGKIKKLRNRI